LVIAAILAALCTPGLRGAQLPTYGAEDDGPPVLLNNADGRNVYAGVVRLQSRATCTGAFIDTSPERPDEAPAYVLTNGHCVDFPGSNDVKLNLPARGQVVFDYFVDTVPRQRPVAIAAIPYATMKGIDVAVVELSARYGDLVRSGVTPLAVARQAPRDNEAVVIVGAPLQPAGVPPYLRLVACRLEGVAPIVLEFTWHWFQSARNPCLGIQPGSSGSPVISRISESIIGLVNTTTAQSRPESACYLDSPCEPGDGVATFLANTNYSSPVVGLAECFDNVGRFVLSRGGCPLDPGGLVPSPGNRGGVNPTLGSPWIGLPTRTWDVAVDRTFAYYRFKVVEAIKGDCQDIGDYGRAQDPLLAPRINEPLPLDEGLHLLCVIGGPNRPAGRQLWSADFPSVVPVRIDLTPPSLQAQVRVSSAVNGWSVAFGSIPYEVSGHVFKFGRVAETRCSDPADYRLALIPFIFIPRGNFPTLLCVIPFDDAGNGGTVFEQLLF
jgi:hypothetical protein